MKKVIESDIASGLQQTVHVKVKMDRIQNPLFAAVLRRPVSDSGKLKDSVKLVISI